MPTSQTAAEESATLESAGIEDEFKKLVHKGNFNAADKLLERNNVRYSHSTTRVNPSEDISAEKIYLNPEKNSSSEQHLYATAVTSERHLLELAFDLEPAGNVGLDCSGPNDGMAISYSEVPYQSLPDTFECSDWVSKDETHEHGVVGTFNDSDRGMRQTPWMEVEVRERDNFSGSTTIYSDYIHTWDPGCSGSGWSAAFTLSSAGNFSVSTSGYIEDYRSEDSLQHRIY